MAGARTHDAARVPVPVPTPDQVRGRLFRDHALTHHAGHAAGLAARRAQSVLQIAARVRTLSEIAGPHIGPRPTTVFSFPRGPARHPVRIRLGVKVAVVAAEPVDAK